MFLDTRGPCAYGWVGVAARRAVAPYYYDLLEHCSALAAGAAPCDASAANGECSRDPGGAAITCSVVESRLVPLPTRR